MSPKKSLVALELISGLFGWIWIACSIGLIVAIGGALFSDWSWWNALYFLFAGSVSKWLTRGFLDNKTRVVFESEMIAHGASAQEAADEWVKAYTGSRK